MLFLRREQKWDEVMYCDLFFTLKNHPEWQKDCGINMPPSNLFYAIFGKRENQKVIISSKGVLHVVLGKDV